MKNLLKISFVIICLIMTGNINAQNHYAMKAPPEPILGVWVAENGNMSYEVEFIKETIYFEGHNSYLDYILGKIIYKTNGDIVRKTEYDKLNSIIYGYMESDLTCDFMFKDSERMVRWRFEFIIDENDPSKAVWKWGLGQGLAGSGWNKENKPDIPDNLTFRKVK